MWKLRHFFTHLPVGTLAAEAEWRVHVLQHVVHLRVVNTAPEQRNKVVNKDRIFSQDNDISLRAGVILRPDPDEFVQVMGTEDGGVPRKIVKIVHDDSNKEIEHQEATQENEGNKKGVGEVWSTWFFRVNHYSCGFIHPWTTLKHNQYYWYRCTCVLGGHSPGLLGRITWY